MLNSLFMILPRNLYEIMSKLPKNVLLLLEEIRVRENRPLEVIYQGKYGFVSVNGTISISNRLSTAYVPTQEDCMQFLDLLSNHSLYTMEEELKRGYVTVRGGHRIGLAGTVVMEKGEVRQLQTISSFNVRLAREVKDVGKTLLPHLMDHAAKTVHHTLVISPPQQGKTTLARDLARSISYGMWPDSGVNWGGLKVGIVDERSELAACHKGVPSFDVGPRTDVLDSCPKAEGMMMMIRSMSPEVIVVDEIGRESDAAAIHEAIHAGIRVIATAHGRSIEDVKRRLVFQRLMAENVFSRYVVLSRSYSNGFTECVYDNSGNLLNSTRLQGVRV